MSTVATPRQATRVRQVAPAVAPLDLQSRRTMLAVLMRNEQAYAAAEKILTPQHFEGIDTPAGILWRLTMLYRREVGGLPEKDFLYIRLENLLGQEGLLLSPVERDDTYDLLEWAMEPSNFTVDMASSAAAKYAVATLKHFLLDRYTASGVRTLQGITGARAGDPAAAIRELSRQVDSVNFLGANPTVDIFAAGWQDKTKPAFTPIGIGPIDQLANGGMIAGEVGLFMAPYGTCKTLTAVQGVCEASLAAEAAEAQGRQSSIVVYAAYETLTDDFRNRVLSYLAEIPLTRLIGIGTYSELRGPGTPLFEYEMEHFASLLEAGVEILSERDRAERAAAIVKKHLVYLDMTGSTGESFNVGGGGIPEMAMCLTEAVDRHTRPCFAVWMDHLTACMSRYTAAAGLDDKAKHNALETSSLVLRDLIAVPNGCPVMALHQLSGEANSRSALSKLHHTNAAGCKSVGMYADIAIMAHHPDDKNISTFTLTKKRNRPPAKDRYVRIDGAYSQITDVTEMYQLSASGRSLTEIAVPPPPAAGRGRITSEGFGNG